MVVMVVVVHNIIQILSGANRNNSFVIILY